MVVKLDSKRTRPIEIDPNTWARFGGQRVVQEYPRNGVDAVSRGWSYRYVYAFPQFLAGLEGRYPFPSDCHRCTGFGIPGLAGRAVIQTESAEFVNLPTIFNSQCRVDCSKNFRDRPLGVLLHELW